MGNGILLSPAVEANKGLATLTRRWLLLLVILIVAGIFYAVIWKDAPYIANDSGEYMRTADDLSDFQLSELRERTPGYPLFLLLMGSTEKPSQALFFVQLALYLVAVGLLGLVLRALEVPFGLIVLFVILALLPYNVLYSAYVLTELFSGFLFVIFFVGLFFYLKTGRWLYLVISAFFLAYSVITRPTNILLPVLFGGSFLLAGWFLKPWKRRLGLAALFLIIFEALLVGGYVLYNRINFNFTGLTPLLGFNLSTRTVRVIERLPDEYKVYRNVLVKTRDSYILSPEDEYHEGYYYAFSATDELMDVTGLSKVEVSNQLVKLNLILISKAPIVYLEEVGHSMVNFWFPSTLPKSNFDSRWLQLVWSAIHFMVVGVFLVYAIIWVSLMIVMAMAIFKRKSQLLSYFYVEETWRLVFSTIAMAFPFYLMAISSFMESGYARFRVPSDLMVLFTVMVGFVIVRNTWFRLNELIRRPLAVK
jgi:hypothetical protein